MKYDAETPNGIPYFGYLYADNFEYRDAVDTLDELYPIKHEAFTTGNTKSYSIGSRSVTKTVLSARDVLKLWDKMMAEKLRLEQRRSKRRTLGVVFRDW